MRLGKDDGQGVIVLEFFRQNQVVTSWFALTQSHMPPADRPFLAPVDTNGYHHTKNSPKCIPKYESYGKNEGTASSYVEMRMNGISVSMYV